jgi:hypothetical protein
MEQSVSAEEMLVIPNLGEPAKTVNITPVKYVSMDVWQKEQDDLDAKTDKVIENPRPPIKKQRNTTSPDAEAVVEDEALQKIGTENWVGLLQRESLDELSFILS